MSQTTLAHAHVGQCTAKRQHTVGQARIVRRRSPTFPARWASYFDATPWGGGYMRVQSAPGAAVLHDDICMDIRTGRVYRDERFADAR